MGPSAIGPFLFSMRDRFVLFAAFLLVAASAQADTVFVDQLATGGTNGASWEDAFTTIQDGIDNASSGDDIWVAEGTYTESIDLSSGLSVYGGFFGDESALNERDITANLTIIEAAADMYRGVTLSSVADVRLDGFTVTGGDANGDSGLDDTGGGILASNVTGASEIANCVIADNRADSRGGGLYIRNSVLTVSDSAIANNTGSAAQGAGVRVESSTITILRTTFSGNSDETGDAGVTNGGGLYIGGASQGLIADSTFSGNVVEGDGGGVFYARGDITFSNCLFLGNESVDRWGGAMRARGSSGETLTVENCTFAGNSARRGGAISVNADSGTRRAINNTFRNNVASEGGGAYDGFQGSFTLQNNVFAGNDAVAAYESSASGGASLANNVFFGNPNGDYYDFGTDTIYTGANELDGLFGSTDTVDADPAFEASVSGSWTSVFGYSSDADSTLLIDASANYATNALAGRVIRVDTTAPLHALVLENTSQTLTILGDVTTVAGPSDSYEVLDLHLSPASSAIDAGIATNAPSDDFDGEGRPFNVLIDIGADEWVDTDDDGLSDYAENAIYNTDAGDADSDDDGLEDGDEIAIGFDPNVDDSAIDTDGDNVTDIVEIGLGSDRLTFEIWVDFAHGGVESGLPTEPYNTLDEALSALPANGAVRVNGASSISSGTVTSPINQAATLIADGGTVTLTAP